MNSRLHSARARARRLWQLSGEPSQNIRRSRHRRRRRRRRRPLIRPSSAGLWTTSTAPCRITGRWRVSRRARASGRRCRGPRPESTGAPMSRSPSCVTSLEPRTRSYSPDGPTGDARDYHAGNEMFSRLDAWMLQGVLRHFRPRRMVEVGCGWSSLLTARINREYLDGGLHFTCVEPYPPEFLAGGVDGISELIVSPVQELALDPFLELGRGDVLFIDSYPEEWVLVGRAWNEQYLAWSGRSRPSTRRSGSCSASAGSTSIDLMCWPRHFLTIRTATATAAPRCGSSGP